MSTFHDSHWLSRYLLQAPPQGQTTSPANAAVLLPLFRHDGEWTLLMTRRALHLRHHPGQLSFPGGRIEAGESSEAAALREAFEETGIAAGQIRLLGQLPAINTSTGFIVQPWLGLMDKLPALQLQQDEVDSVLLLPLHEALSDRRRQTEIWPLRGKKQRLFFIPWQQHLIWGASAEILYLLAQQLAPPSR